MINQSFWKNKRVFVSGHTGFKGSWLSLWLHSLGASVQGYALNRPTDPSLFDVVGLEKTLRSEQGDIRDFEHLSACLRAFKPEIVFHLAAQPLVRPSYVNPMETYTTNVIGTVSLFEAVRAVGGVKALVNVTSDKCYENKEWLWGYRENEPMGGFDPYSNSKGCVELVTASYQQSFFNEAAGCALASARAGNVIGGGDWAADRLIPDILRTFSQEQTLSVRHPQAIRPWQHVLEPLSGYMMLAEKLYTEGLAYAQAWNFGPEDRDARPVHWIVEQMAQRWGGDPAWVHDTSPQPHEAHYLKLDCSKEFG
ncbi:MAG: CDP-glucose 4,6-dehydratase [Legionellaceae bacterium]